MSKRADLPPGARQQALIAALQKSGRFPHASRKVRLVETHISWVLLAGRYAYKIKKALNLGFLDFSTLEARHHFCEEEIRLNRRLAPKIYLDVVPVGGLPDAPEIGREPAIEYAVRMRRFAVSKELDRLLPRGKVMPQHMDKLGVALADFHEGLPRVDATSAYGSPATIRAAALQNCAQLQTLLTERSDRGAVDSLRFATEQAYAACEKHFAQRHAQGFVRECHGDLHLGNIVLIDDQPIPFDGIEFNPALRWIDVMDEVAFLVMDLLHGKRVDLAFRFLNVWLEKTGDYAGVAVLRFYLAYRAAVRAKVNAIRAFQPGQDERFRMRELADCRDYLALASECLSSPRPALIITHGLPGSGKSTVAQAALERIGAIRIRSDVERKRLFGMDALGNSRSGTGEGIYSADATRHTYARLHELARGLLDAGFPVIVDAAFLRQDERKQFMELASSQSVPFAIVSMQADEATLSARIAKRHQAGSDASEADIAVLHMKQASQQPLRHHELERTVIFRNDAPEWGRLADLLGIAGIA